MDVSPSYATSTSSTISNIMQDDVQLTLRAANGTEIPFGGWVEVCLSLLDPKIKSSGSTELVVPILDP